MQIQLLPLAGCLLRWHQKIDALWHNTPRIRVERTITKGVRAGVEEIIVRRGARIVVDGAKATGEVLLKWYRKRVERLLSTPFLLGAHVTAEGLELPSILVDARVLMQQRSLTERTMRNHLRQLLDIGFIVKKKWHGRKRSFELWINPDFILQEPKIAVENPVEAASEIPTIGAVLSTNGIKFPARELLKHQIDLKEDIGQCAKTLSDDLSKKPSPKEEGCNQVAAAGQAAKEGAGGRGAARPAHIPPPAPDPATAEKQAKNDAYVESAWSYAKALLYSEHRFTPHQEQLARQAIRAGVYRHFEDQQFDFARYHQGVLRRIELVEKYFQKHAADPIPKYAPAPWAEVVHGKGYFDWANEQGFRGTLKWLEADHRSERLAKVNRKIRQAINELKLRLKLDRGEKTTRKPAEHIQATPFLGLYRQHATTIEQLGGLPAANKFTAQVQNLRNFH